MCIRTGQMPYYGFYLAYASEMLHLISPYYGDFIMQTAVMVWWSWTWPHVPGLY